MDNVTFTIYADGSLHSISSHMVDCYDKFKNVQIDTELCNSLIKEEVYNACDIDKYTVTDYRQTSALFIIDGNLCLVSSVSPIMMRSDNSEPVITQPLYLMIPIKQG